ncbi:MAG: hypothetical protein CYPHOPRED_004901 [Cyphobasidiales sp. Tagirdzhanova-0007]|nr:MAG: hypothetical protein CYPHOPRED_004901 [Cyphobasidiales sp. Tagirdzhanova-0007]
MGLASKLAAAGPLGGPGSGPPGSYAQSVAPPPPTSSYPGQLSQPSQSPTRAQFGSAPTQHFPPAYSGQQPAGRLDALKYGQSTEQLRRPGQQSVYAPPSGPPPVGARPAQYGQAPPLYGQSASGVPPPTYYGQQSHGSYGEQSQGGYGQQAPQASYYQPSGGYDQPSQQQPGGYGQPSQQQQPGGGNAGDSGFILSILQQCAQEQNIMAFYPPGSLEPIAQIVAQSGALDRLALFDIILYVDDSGSMAFEQGGERVDDLKLILNRVAYASSLFDSDGIQVRFMNSNIDGDGVRDEQGAAALLQRVKSSGLTPVGTSMDRKILQPLVLGPARAGRLAKPVLIITITDGAPAGEDRYAIAKVIMNANRELKRTKYGSDAISFQFADLNSQVGDDQKAQAFLAELDNHREIGGLVDVTSNYELESEEMLRKSGQELTPELWLVKMLMGGIDNSYDEKDE